MNQYTTGDLDNFIDRFCKLFLSRHDAPPDYILGSACTCLQMAASNVRIKLNITGSSGIGIHQYFLLIGPSAAARKSVSMNTCVRVLRRTEHLKHRVVGESTGAGLLDFMDDVMGGSVLYHRDEMHEVFKSIYESSPMHQLNSILLEMHKKMHYTYHRAKKRSGKQRHEDAIKIRDTQLSVLGAATTALYDDLSEKMIRNGLLGRFNILTNVGQADRNPFSQDPERLDQWAMEESMLAGELDQLFLACSQYDDHITVRFDDDALKLLDQFQAKLERKDAETYKGIEAIFQRLGTESSLRCSTLIALGRGPSSIRNGVVHVTKEDTITALRWCKRWQQNAIEVGARTGGDFIMRHTKAIFDLARAMCNGDYTVLRRDVQRKYKKISINPLKEVEDNLRSMGAIEVEQKGKSIQWKLLTSNIEVEKPKMPALTIEPVPDYEDEDE